MEEERIQEEREAFTITDDKAADWAVRKIKEEAAERDRLLELVAAEEQALAEKKEQILKRYDSATGYLKGLLAQYFETVPTKETKTQRTYQLLNGKLKLKKGGIDYQRDDEALLSWCKEEMPAVVKVKETVDWANLKKILTVTEQGKVLIADTGEIVESITAVQKADTFEVDF